MVIILSSVYWFIFHPNTNLFSCALRIHSVKTTMPKPSSSMKHMKHQVHNFHFNSPSTSPDKVWMWHEMSYGSRANWYLINARPDRRGRGSSADCLIQYAWFTSRFLATANFPRSKLHQCGVVYTARARREKVLSSNSSINTSKCYLDWANMHFICET